MLLRFSEQGDHDHRGNVSAQLAFSARSGGKFTLPAPYYSRSIAFDMGGSGGSVGAARLRLIVTDSVGLEGREFGLRRFAEDLDPKFTSQQASEKQWLWLASKLKRPSATRDEGAFTLVVGHRPILSLAARSRTEPELATGARLEALLQKHAANLYLGGHDHTMQHFELDQSEGGGTALHAIVNGVGGFNTHPFAPAFGDATGSAAETAAAEANGSADTPYVSAASRSMTKRARAALRWRLNETFGFILHEMTSDGMDLHFIDVQGELLRTTSVPN